MQATRGIKVWHNNRNKKVARLFWAVDGGLYFESKDTGCMPVNGTTICHVPVRYQQWINKFVMGYEHQNVPPQILNDEAYKMGLKESNMGRVR